MTQKEIERTEIEAPYELPEGWKWVKIGDIAEIINGKNQKDVEDENGVYPIYGSGGIIGKARNFICPENCTIIGRKGTINNPIFVETKFWNVDTAFGMKTFDCVNPKFYFYFCKSYNFTTLDSSTAIPSLTKTNIQQIPFPLPPTLAEQQRIVNRIETMFAKLDQAQEKAQVVLDSFETRKAAILHKAFSGQLRIDNEELTIEDWEEKSFSDLGTSNLGKMLDANKNTGDEIRYLRNINVRWFDFDLSDLLTMRAKPEEIKKLSVKKGDLFICEGGEPGRCAVWKDENADLIFQKAIHRFRPNDGVSSDFVAYVLYYYNQIGILSDYFTGTTIKHLTGQSLAKIPIRIPSLNYQLSIVNFLDTVLEKESRAKEAAQTVLDQIALLKKSILAKAFRGEL